MSRVTPFRRQRQPPSSLEGPQPKYDPQDFMIPARDHKGATDRLFLNLQPGHKRGLVVVAGSQRFPFKDANDVARWCIDHGLKVLETLEDLELHTKQIDAIMALVRESEWLATFTTMFDECDRVCRMHQGQGDDDMVKRLIGQVSSEIADIKDDAWRAKYQREFERRFGWVLDTGKKGKRR